MALWIQGIDLSETGKPHLGKLGKVSSVEKIQNAHWPQLASKGVLTNSHVEMNHRQKAAKY